MRVRRKLLYSTCQAQEGVLKESDDLDILGVTFDSKMTFEKHLRSVSRAASQILGILRKSWQVSHDRSLLGRCFRGFILPFWSTVRQCGAQLPIHTLKWCPFSNWAMLHIIDFSSSICSSTVHVYAV